MICLLKYKEIVYEKVEYEPTSVILGKINDLEIEIQQELEKLQEVMLRELGSNREETEKLAIQW